jgi:glycosyltransferase involved in cell wall biosynthesis
MLMTGSRIVHYNHTGVIAGAERVLLDALPQLREEGLHSIVVSPAGPLQNEAALLGVEVAEWCALQARFTCNPIQLARYVRSFGATIRGLRSQIRSLQPDTVHANSVRAGLVASSATIGMNTSIVWHVHDTLPRHPLSIAIRGFAALSRRTSHIAVSHATARTFCGTLWKRSLAAKTDVLHNVFAGGRGRAVSTLQQRTRLRAELGANTGFLIGCVGQICPRKNQVGMVEAFAEVLKVSPDALLVIVGSVLFAHHVIYEDRLKQKIQDLGISESVRLLGKRDDVPLLLETIDLLVLPSHKEPFPMILLEAMHAGAATVAFAVDGVPELLADRRTAWLVRPGEDAQLARTILWAMQHPEQRTRLASAARMALAKRDTPKSYGTRLANILRRHGRAVQASPAALIADSQRKRLSELA